MCKSYNGCGCHVGGLTLCKSYNLKLCVDVMQAVLCFINNV